MAEGTRQASAVEAHTEAKAHSAHRQTSEPTAAPLTGSRASVARMLALRAGNAAAVRVLRAPSDEPMPAPAQDLAPVSGDPPGPESAPIEEPAPALAQDPAPESLADDGPQSEPLDEAEPMPAPAQDPAPASEDDSDSESEPLEDSAPMSVGMEAAVSEPADELAPYRSEMVDHIQMTTAARTGAVATRDRYQAIVHDLARAADPGNVTDVEGDLAARLIAARVDYHQFENASGQASAEFDRIIAQADEDYTAALDGREALTSGADAVGWLRRLGTAQGIYHGVQEGLPEAMAEIVEAALGFARIGRDMEQADYVQAVLPVADAAQAAGSAAPPTRPDLTGIAARATRTDNRATGVGYGDAVNNTVAVITAGIGFGITTVAAVTSGLVSTGIGILFAAVGTILAIRAVRGAAAAQRRIAAAEQYLSSTEAKQIAQYAKRQKARKEGRQKGLAAAGGATALVGGAAIGLALVGVTTAAIATAGVVVAVVGLALALAGLGIGIRKYLTSRRKRAAEAKAAMRLADAYEAAARDGDAEAAGVVQSAGDRAGLEAWAATRITGQRHNSATQLVAMLTSEVPSDRFNGETIVEALGVSPAEVRATLEVGDPGLAIGMVERKLASW